MTNTPDAQRIANAVTRAEAQIVNQHNASLAGCAIDGPLFRIGGRDYPITDVSAEMELGAPSSKGRTTITRLVAGGMIAGPAGMLVGGAAKKRTDTTRIYLTVRTPDGRVEVKSCPAQQEQSARRFMAKLEMATKRQWPLTSSVGTVLPLHASSVRPSDTHALQQGMAVLFALVLLVWAFNQPVMWIAFVLFVVGAVVAFVRSDQRHRQALEAYKRTRP